MLATFFPDGHTVIHSQTCTSLKMSINHTSSPKKTADWPNELERADILGAETRVSKTQSRSSKSSMLSFFLWIRCMCEQVSKIIISQLCVKRLINNSNNNHGHQFCPVNHNYQSSNFQGGFFQAENWQQCTGQQNLNALPLLASCFWNSHPAEHLVLTASCKKGQCLLCSFNWLESIFQFSSLWIPALPNKVVPAGSHGYFCIALFERLIHLRVNYNMW